MNVHDFQMADADARRDSIRAMVRDIARMEADIRWAWRFFVYGMLAVFVGVVLGACRTDPVAPRLATRTDSGFVLVSPHDSVRVP